MRRGFAKPRQPSHAARRGPFRSDRSSGVAYLIHLSDADRDYLQHVPMSETAKGKVTDFIAYGIANVDDAFRKDPANRPWPDAPYFQRDLLLLDVDGDQLLHRVNFIVRDEA